ncbi:lysocardiolipin acyltransferase 1-like [Oratosquilla oratoria]|uniref:lysocardiolipin acyltransferase 1-like n=1 Tax=Oratosquilla oratoria TaxID=337810 RepID=UPI003F75F32A
MHLTMKEKSTSPLDWARGIAYLLLWYGSIMMGFFSLYCPILPLLVIHRPTYRKLTEAIFVMWESFAVAILEILYGVRIRVTGDPLRSDETSILLLNHRNRLDWNFFWMLLGHGTLPPAHNCKFVLKSVISKFPGLGWIMQMCCFLYIRRRWEDDQKLMKSVLDYYRDIEHIYQVLLFPEGTNLTPYTKSRSDAFAEKFGLQKFEYVLHPRTTGFCYLLDTMRKSKEMKAVYDITVAYPRTLPVTEVDIIRGRIPEEIHFHVKRYSVDTIPTSEEGSKDWLQQVWTHKEERLRRFHTNDFRFLEEEEDGKTGGGGGGGGGGTNSEPEGGAAADRKFQPLANASYGALLLWLPLTFGMAYLVVTSIWVFLWCLVHTIIFCVISFGTDGLQHFEIRLFRRWEKSRQRLTENVDIMNDIRGGEGVRVYGENKNGDGSVAGEGGGAVGGEEEKDEGDKGKTLNIIKEEEEERVDRSKEE